MKKILNVFIVITLVLTAGCLFAQQVTISGSVIDAKTGDPLAYANVSIEGKEVGAATDEDGYFSYWYALDGMDALEETIDRTRQNLKHDISILGVLVTQFRRGTTVHTELLEQLRKYWGDKVFDTMVHINIDVAAAAMDELPVVVFKPESQAGKDYLSLAKEVLDREKQIQATDSR